MESCVIAKCFTLFHFKNNKTMAIVIQKIVIKAFHSFMVLSMFLLLTGKENAEFSGTT